jgi:hypothetical protein
VFNWAKSPVEPAGSDLNLNAQLRNFDNGDPVAAIGKSENEY